MTDKKRTPGTIIMDVELKDMIKVAAKKDRRSFNGYIEEVMARKVGYKG